MQKTILITGSTDGIGLEAAQAPGLETCTGFANLLMIVCNGCGFVAKSFVIAR